MRANGVCCASLRISASHLQFVNHLEIEVLPPYHPSGATPGRWVVQQGGRAAIARHSALRPSFEKPAATEPLKLASVALLCCHCCRHCCCCAEEERGNWELFAANVRQLMGQRLGVPLVEQVGGWTRGRGWTGGW